MIRSNTYKVHVPWSALQLVPELKKAAKVPTGYPMLWLWPLTNLANNQFAGRSSPASISCIPSGPYAHRFAFGSVDSLIHPLSHQMLHDAPGLVCVPFSLSQSFSMPHAPPSGRIRMYFVSAKTIIHQTAQALAFYCYHQSCHHRAKAIIVPLRISGLPSNDYPLLFNLFQHTQPR